MARSSFSSTGADARSPRKFSILAATKFDYGSCTKHKRRRCAAGSFWDRRFRKGKTWKTKWQQIAIEAAKQCGQNWLPRLHAPGKLADFFDAVEAEAALSDRRTGVSPAESPMSQPSFETLPELQKDIVQFDLRLIGSLQPDAQHLKKILADYSSEHQQRPQSVLMLIGPEGDFTPAELALARRHGCQPITLGPIILRVETAAIYCLSVLSYELLM
ncbi:MAG: hypothetical protein DME87_03780 [Verrucomicrobia bacterium]|nr:MAG: hypothetical protein DME87_03780 [Verrucomicrobiota bacterium]